MDRFIVFVHTEQVVIFLYLKSNMDRFIEGAWPFLLCIVPHLKSNMDRFIVEVKTV